jgi:hypothetical protein
MAVIWSSSRRSSLVTVTVAPSTCVSKGRSRCSSNIVNQPKDCSDSSWASTVASSIISASLALLSRAGVRGAGLFAGVFDFMGSVLVGSVTPVA